MRSADAVRQVIHFQTVIMAGMTTAFAGAAAIKTLGLAELGIATLLTAVSSGVLGAAAIHIALKRKKLWSVLVSTLGFCLLAALINSPVCFFLTGLFTSSAGLHGSAESLASGTLLAAIFGPIIAGPLGVGFGLVFAVATGHAHLVRESPTIDAPDRHGLLLGGIAFLVSCLVAVVESSTNLSSPSFVLAAPLLVCSGLAVAVFASRMLLRRVWLARVRQDRVAGWTVVSVLDVEVGPEVLPFGRHGFSSAVLAETIPPVGDGAYRAARRVRPFALIGVAGN